MKRLLVVLVLNLLLVSPLLAGGTFVYPNEKTPLFSITFPDTWETKFDDNGKLHAYTANWEVSQIPRPIWEKGEVCPPTLVFLPSPATLRKKP